MIKNVFLIRLSSIFNKININNKIIPLFGSKYKHSFTRDTDKPKDTDKPDFSKEGFPWE